MDTKIPRFTSIDPPAEKYYSMSPYAYCANNPIFFVDPTGDSIVMYFYDERGRLMNTIPDIVRNMFATEFGINLGYNARTKMAYFDGYADSDLSQSSTATQILVDALSDDNKWMKHGMVVFGHNIKDFATGASVNEGS